MTGPTGHSARGLRTRSGNAMLRTRAALLDAAADCVARDGVRRTTMAQVAATGGVAKATLYNHFRTKDDVLAALVEARVAALAEECAALAAGLPDPHPVPGLATPERATGLGAALEHAAASLASSRPLRRVAADEPALLVPLAVPGDGRGWQAALAAVTGVLTAAGASAAPADVELVLRWLLSQLLWPAAPGGVGPLVRALAGGASSAPSEGRSEAGVRAAGLGWPAEPDRLRTR